MNALKVIGWIVFGLVTTIMLFVMGSILLVWLTLEAGV